MACKIRININKLRLPINHRYLNRVWYLEQTLYKAWKFHLYAHNLQIEEIVFRRIIYDAVYDALINEYDKIRHKDFLKEYAKFQKYWNENFSHLNEKIIDWINYRESSAYQVFIENLKHIRRFDRRVQTSIDHALAFMYAKFQKGFVLGETLEKIEKKLRLDKLKKVWSKKWPWITAYILFFDANDLYARTITRSDWYIYGYDELTGEAIKIKVTRWYERKDLALSSYEKNLFRVYEHIICPTIAELGSVALAEAARRGTCIALLHATRMLANFATYDPRLKVLLWGSELLGSLAQILNNSVLAWIGWQISVEWTLDGTIQAFLNEALKHVYATFTGKKIWRARQWADWGLFDLACYYQYLKYVSGIIRPDQQELIDFIYQHGSEKQKDILDRIAKTIQVAQSLYNFKKFFWQTEKKFLHEAKNLLDAAMQREEDFYWAQTHNLTRQFLEGWAKQKIYELQPVKDENTLDLDWYSMKVQDKKSQFTDENGMKHTKYESLRENKIFVPLKGCYWTDWSHINSMYACDLAYVENFYFYCGLDVAEKEEYNSEEAEEFIKSLLDRTNTVLYWRYGVREAWRSKDLFKLPLLFLSDLIRPRITYRCISVIYQHKRFYKYVLDYDSRYNGKTLVYRYLASKHYTDNYQHAFSFLPCGRDLPTNHIECADIDMEQQYFETGYSIHGARVWEEGYSTAEGKYHYDSWHRYFTTSFSSAKVAELKISFTENEVIWEKKNGFRWQAGVVEDYNSLRKFLNELPIQRYVLRLQWILPHRTFKRLSKRSKLVCF